MLIRMMIFRSEQASAVLVDALTVHEAIRKNNNTTRFEISHWRVE